VRHRILFFLSGRTAAVLAHAIVKKTDKVPEIDIDRAIDRMERFKQDPSAHTYEGDEWDEQKGTEEDA
jgi:phage-related protein